MTVSTYRQLSREEKAILDRLLAEPFPGRDELRDQIAHTRVQTRDEDGSIKFASTSGAEAKVVTRVRWRHDTLALTAPAY